MYGGVYGGAYPWYGYGYGGVELLPTTTVVVPTTETTVLDTPVEGLAAAAVCELDHPASPSQQVRCCEATTFGAAQTACINAVLRL